MAGKSELREKASADWLAVHLMDRVRPGE